MSLVCGGCVTVQQWSSYVRWVLHARAGRCKAARRDGHMPQLPCGDQQNLGFTQPGCREGCERAAFRMPVLQQGVSQEYT